MALQTSGQISLNDMHIEVGGSSGTQVSINDADIRGLISKASGAQMAFNEWYGAANVYIPSSGTTINGQSNLQEITISDYISAGETFEVPSNFWIWSDNRNTAAMIIDISCTIINKGKIIGKGGNQEEYGGPAIKINSGITGVTIQNNSGAYIAGGGGGGASQGGGGGGGAGGGGTSSGQGSGGALNASGTAGYNNNNGRGSGGGGGAGGAGGGTEGQPFVSQTGAQGGGGGRILPGTGGIAYSSIMAPGGNGGSAGNNGSNGTTTQAAIDGGGGGGGWGANGGNIGGQYARSGATGGKAIEDSGQSYTLTNNGTIYGGT